MEDLRTNLWNAQYVIRAILIVLFLFFVRTRGNTTRFTMISKRVNHTQKESVPFWPSIDGCHLKVSPHSRVGQVICTAPYPKQQMGAAFAVPPTWLFVPRCPVLSSLLIKQSYIVHLAWRMEAPVFTDAGGCSRVNLTGGFWKCLRWGILTTMCCSVVIALCLVTGRLETLPSPFLRAVPLGKSRKDVSSDGTYACMIYRKTDAATDCTISKAW